MRDLPTTPQWVCEHCYVHLVNGDCTEPDTCCNGQPHRTPLALFVAPMYVTPGILSSEHADGCPNRNDYRTYSVECDCETHTFSWTACDGCGSNLGGSRYAVTGWTPRKD